VRLGLVVPRYGAEVVGGTEHWLRLLCEHLVAERGAVVEVFTTCALSAATWADELAPGTTEEGGVTVHRHRSRSGRDPRSALLRALVSPAPALVPEAVARRLVELAGPVCPEVVAQAEASTCALVAVTPYLYWPSVTAAARLGRRVVFHGAAHDEPELHLPLMPAVYGAVGGFAFNSFAEQALVQRCFAVAERPCAVVGNAVVEGAGDPGPARAALGLAPDEPFVLGLGRVERAKGSHALAELWRLYRSRRPAAPRLVLLGPVHDALAPNADVVVAGRTDEAVKWGALRGAAAVVVPSAWESFSLVVLEAWLAGAPVVVNRRCEATMEHCRRGRGGLWFDGYADFEAVMDRLLADDGLRRDLARRGRAYTERTFGWPAVLDRYQTLTDRILASLSPAAAPAGAGRAG